MQTGLAVAPNITHEASALTDLQRLYWIGHQLRPSATHFNNAFSFAFATPICPELFIQAFAAAVCQYDALHTVIEERDDQPQAIVLPEQPVELDFVDLSDAPDPEAAAERWQATRVRQPFTLDRCLYDAALLKLAEAKYVWFLNQHHLITDASSFFLIAESVLAQYDNLRQGQPLVPAPKPTFARYAASLRRQQQSSRAEASRRFWQEKLAQKPDPFRFYGRSQTKRTSQVARWTYQLSSKQTGRLMALADEVDIGTATAEFRQFCLTAALFFALMHQLTGNSRLGFVTTIHNRATQVNRQTVGVLMELCPVLVTIEPGETFVSLMQKVAAEMKQLLLHYRYGASQAASDLALDVMFTFVQRPSLQLDNQPIAHKIIHPGAGSERLGLHVHHLADSNQYELYLDLHQDIFSEAQRTHAQQSLQALLGVVLAEPEADIMAFGLPWPACEDGNSNGRFQPAFEPPTTPVEGVLQQIWQDVLERSPIGVHDDFFALGGESWQAMSFLTRFEAATGHYLPLSALITSSTIAGLARQIEQPVQRESIIEIQAGEPNRPPFFFVPGAAGNTLAISRVAQQMSPAQPVYSFQIPPLDFDNLPAAQVSQLATYYLDAIQSVQPHGPYYLGGYSAGGIFTYEIAQQLRGQGETVSFLAVIDMPAPNPLFEYWWRLCHFMASLLGLPAGREEKIYLFGRDCWSRVIYFWGRGLKVWLWRYGRYAQHVWQMPLPQKWLRLKQKLRRAKPEAVAGRRPVLRDMDPSSLTDPRARTLFDLYDRAARCYLPKPYDGPVTLLRCPLGYGRKELRSPTPDYGWAKLTTQLETHVVQADGHLALVQEPAVARVGQLLQDALTKTFLMRKLDHDYETTN